MANYLLGLVEQEELATLGERQALSTYMKIITSQVHSLRCWLMQGKWCQSGLAQEEGATNMGCMLLLNHLSNLFTIIYE